MSGQRNKKPSDAVKARQEYLDNLSLEVQLNDANEQAVKQFKETGQVPPISQMKDMRTTTQILADTEKLKISLIKDLEPIADPQFAQAIVSRLIQSPLNMDNRLLVFAAQRVDDLVKNLQKTYKYGIRGDANDAEQFVNFINKFYSDQNKLTTNTKAFMNRMGTNSDSGLSSRLSRQHSTLVSTLADFNSIHRKIFLLVNQIAGIPGCPPIPAAMAGMFGLIVDTVVDKLTALIQFIPSSSDTIKKIEQLAVQEPGTLGFIPALDDYSRWLEFYNHNIPNLDYITIILADFVKQQKNLESMIKTQTSSQLNNTI